MNKIIKAMASYLLFSLGIVLISKSMMILFKINFLISFIVNLVIFSIFSAVMIIVLKGGFTR